MTTTFIFHYFSNIINRNSISMDGHQKPQSTFNLFNYGTIVVAIIAMLISAWGIEKNHRDFEKSLVETRGSVIISKQQYELSVRQYEDSKKQLEIANNDAIAQKYLQRIQFEKQIQLANEQSNIYKQQVLVAKGQYEIVQNEMNTKMLAGFLRLRFTIEKIHYIHPYFGQDSLRLCKDFNKVENRLTTLKQIKNLIDSELDNIVIFKNDTIGSYWRSIYDATSSELLSNDGTYKGTIAYVNDKGRLEAKEDIDKFKLNSFWEYTKYLNKKLTVISLFISLKLKKLRTSETEKQLNTFIIKDRFNDDDLIKRIIQERGY